MRWRSRPGDALHEEEAECHVAGLGDLDPVKASYRADCQAAIGKEAMHNYMPMPPTGDVPKTNADATVAAKELIYALTTPP